MTVFSKWNHLILAWNFTLAKAWIVSSWYIPLNILLLKSFDRWSQHLEISWKRTLKLDFTTFIKPSCLHFFWWKRNEWFFNFVLFRSFYDSLHRDLKGKILAKGRDFGFHIEFQIIWVELNILSDILFQILYLGFCFLGLIQYILESSFNTFVCTYQRSDLTSFRALHLNLIDLFS